jgi:hypothetical protein
MRDGGRIRGIDGKASSADFAGERPQLIDIAGRQTDLEAGCRQPMCDRCADA